MRFTEKPMQRRDFLRGSLAAAALIPASGLLASCASSGTDTGSSGASSPAGNVSDTNPFGMAANSTVDAVIFNGGYGIAYTEFAGEQVEKLQAGSTVKVT
ncbi:MAG: twin-arginine translocation signal domain-containing protein, partial [Mycobacterium sp.]